MALLIGALVAVTVWITLAPGQIQVFPDAERFGNNLYARAARRLYQARLPLTPAEFAALHLAAPLAAAAGVWVLTSGSWLAAVCAAPTGTVVLLSVLQSWSRSRLTELRGHFQEALLSLSTSLRAGKSLTEAVKASLADLDRLHRNPPSPLVPELEQVLRDVQLGITRENALVRLSERVPLDEVKALADVVRVSLQRGGNLVSVIGTVVNMIADKFAMEREIQAVTAEKRLESIAVPLVPIILYLVLRGLSPGYMEPFTRTTWGQIALGVAFLLTSAAFFVAQRLGQIKF